MYTKFEQETIVNFNEAEEIAEVYTYNKQLKSKLDSISKNMPEICKVLKKDSNGARTYEILKSCISINKPRKLSEEHKKKLVEAGSKTQIHKRINNK